MKHNRVLVIEAHPDVRHALRVLLQRKQPAGCEVVGELITADQVIDEAARLRPDVIMLEWSLIAPHAGTLAQLRAHFPGTAIIAMSATAEARQAALTAGADAFVNKGEPADGVIRALAALA